MLRTTVNALRLVRIAVVLARHDAFAPLAVLPRLAPYVAALRWLARRDAAGRPGQRLAAALITLGPTFIKLGQTLATRSDLLGEEVTADLAALQDRLAPFPTPAARAVIEDELDQPIMALFTRFEDTPVAAASIAQVHFAETADGREVAVKVLRPGIEAAFARDIDLFEWLADGLERWLPRMRRLRPRQVVSTFADTVRLEMDLRMEAAAASELAENFLGEPSFHVPAVDWPRTGRRVLTIDRVRGIRIDDLDALAAAGIDRNEVLRNAAEAFFNQVFRDGFFHADMHPGNMFVTPDGRLVPVDFGIMGRVDIATRHYLADMLTGFLTGDYRKTAEVHFRAGYVPVDQSVDAFTQACRSIGEPIMGKPLHEISLARLLGQLFAITERFHMETQPQLLLLQKTMLVAEGVGRRLNPEINMWEMARPLIEEWVIENRGPEARLRDAGSRLGEIAERLPGLLADLEKAAGEVARGGLRLHPDTVRALTTGVAVRRARFWPLWVAIAVLAAIALL